MHVSQKTFYRSDLPNCFLSVIFWTAACWAWSWAGNTYQPDFLSAYGTTDFDYSFTSKDTCSSSLSMTSPKSQVGLIGERKRMQDGKTWGKRLENTDSTLHKTQGENWKQLQNSKFSEDVELTEKEKLTFSQDGVRRAGTNYCKLEFRIKATIKVNVTLGFLHVKLTFLPI